MAELNVMASSLKAEPPGAAILGEREGGSPAHAMRSSPFGPLDCWAAACPLPFGAAGGAAQADSSTQAKSANARDHRRGWKSPNILLPNLQPPLPPGEGWGEGVPRCLPQR